MRILLISNELPPFNGSGNIRVMNYINYLNRIGNKVDVVTVDYPKDCVAYDDNLENVFDKEVNIYRLKSGKMHKYFYQKKGKVNSNITKTSKHKFKARITTYIKNNLIIPDQYMFWINNAYKQCMKLIECNDYDMIFSIHERPSAHLVALKVKKKNPKIRWVGYWSDPWNGDKLKKNRGILKRTTEEYLEKQVVENVDKLLFTTEQTKNFYKNKYRLHNNKLDIVYRGYCAADYEKVSNNRNNLEFVKKDKFNIIHTGIIYKGMRDVNPLVLALNEISDKNTSLYKSINIIFIGMFTDDEDKRKLKQFECVEIYDAIPYNQIIEYIENADALLLYGNKDSIQVPGKVYEYLGSKAPVLTILGDEKDELKEFMSNLDKGQVVNNTKEEIVIAIDNIVNNCNDHWKKRVEKYEWVNVVNDLEKKLF